MLADFTITVHEARKPLAVRVVVHENVPTLRKEAQKHYNTWDGLSNQADLESILGVCHRAHMADSPVYAVVRLAPPHLGAGIVAHEMAHAAVWLWEIQHKFGKPLVSADDEWFCWVLGELVRQTTIQMLDRGMYDISPENTM